MSAFGTAFLAIGRFVAGAEEEHHFDDQGYTTHHWLLPESAEIIYGGIAFAVILLLGWKFKVVPMAKKAFAARTDKIQDELDASANAKRDAEAEAARIRQNLGNIDAERQRLLVEADGQAEALLADGRARLDVELAELEAKADSDIASVGSRTTDELRAEIARLASQAADKVVERSLDDATIQSLIENYIANVGATGRA
jgi:F-type H+-transporting ATPase subunit b